MYEKKLFIFDLDGTLADAYQAIEKSLNFTRAKFANKPVSYQVIKKNVGNGDKNFIKTFFSKPQADEALRVYRQHHKKSLKKYSRLKPYARMLLYRLRRRKKNLAIASNRPSYYTNIILRSLDIKKYFDCVLCADQIKSLKPNPKILNKILKKFKLKKEAAVYIGDMDVDLETARRARMDVIFVVGGSSTIRDTRKYKEKKIAYNLKDIVKLL